MKILMVNVPYSGHTNLTLPLAENLVKRGHHVVYINSEEFRHKIEETGAEFVPYKDFPLEPSAMYKKRNCFRCAFDTAMQLEDKFDLLIYEMFFYPGIEIARKKNIPCVRQFSQPAWNKETVNDAPKIFQIAVKLIDFQVMGKKRAKKMGLLHTTMKDAILYDKPNLNIVYLPKKFQKDNELFDDSFIFMLPTHKVVSDSKLIPYEEMKHPIIYISLGSIISVRRFYRKCINAFGNTDFSVILNTGKIDPKTLGKIPDNIYAYSFVPQIEVLSHADVFLTHCGMNSVNEAIENGVPMVAMPLLNDQFVNADQIEKIGIGKKVSFLKTSEKELFNTVCEVYKNEQIRKQVEEMKSDVQKQIDWDTLISRLDNL